MPKPFLTVDVSFMSPSSGDNDDVRKFVYSAYSSAPLHSPSPINRHGGGGGSAPATVANASLTSSGSFVLDRTSSMVLRSKGAQATGDSAKAVIHVPSAGQVAPLSAYMLQRTRSLDSGCSTPNSDVCEPEPIQTQEELNDSRPSTAAPACANRHNDGSHNDNNQDTIVDGRVEHQFHNLYHDGFPAAQQRHSSEKGSNSRSDSTSHARGSVFIATPPQASVMGSLSPPVWSLAQQESKNGSPIPSVVTVHLNSAHASIVQMSLLEDDVTPPLYFRDDDDG